MKRLFSQQVIFFCLLFSLSACQNPVEKEPTNAKEGIEHYEKGDYQKALPVLEKAANAGNAEAAYCLANLYRNKEGIKQKETLICQYYVKAAEGSYQDAYLPAGICYHVGEGVSQNDLEALKWGKKAATEWNDSRQSDRDKRVLAVLLGDLYFGGRNTLHDFSEAAKWYEKAAKLDDARAQGKLAFLYYSGQGVLMNDVKARYWAEKAAAQNEDMGQSVLAMLYQYRQKTPNMQKAIYYYEKAAAQKNFAASFQLGTIYENGIGVPRDLAKAHRYYKQAVKNGKRDYLIEALKDFEKEHHLENTD